MTYINIGYALVTKKTHCASFPVMGNTAKHVALTVIATSIPAAYAMRYRCVSLELEDSGRVKNSPLTR